MYDKMSIKKVRREVWMMSIMCVYMLVRMCFLCVVGTQYLQKLPTRQPATLQLIANEL